MEKLLENFNVGKLNESLNKAKKYKEQADTVSATYKDMQEHNDGRATLYIYTNEMKTQVELDSETIAELLIVLHKRYKGLIRETKQEVDKLYETFLGERSCAEKLDAKIRGGDSDAEMSSDG